MRLVSRSLHSQMHAKQHAINTYKKTIEAVLYKNFSSHTMPHAPLFPSSEAPERKLTILIGSQKGLCGTYNAPLNYWLSTHAALFTRDFHDLIVIGKKMQEICQQNSLQPSLVIEEVKFSTIEITVQNLLQRILTAKNPYTHVSFISNHSKNFFARTIKEIVLVPLDYSGNKEFFEETTPPDFTWLNNKEEVALKLSIMLAKNIIHTVIFEALMSEQAARFIAMDNATRNAKELLDTMKIQYNKLRQMKITKELIELTGNFKK